MKSEIYPKAVPVQCLEVQEAGNGALCITSPSGQAEFQLNATARAIWEGCDGTRSINEVGASIAGDLSVDTAMIHDDVVGAMRSLLEAGLLSLEICPAGEGTQDEPVRTSIDWARVAQPQEDLSDIEVALSVFCSKNGDQRLKPGVLGGLDLEHTICDGTVAVVYCYPEDTVPPPSAPRNHPSLAGADEYLRRWPLGRNAVMALIHSLHPFHDPDEVMSGASVCHSSDKPADFGAILSTIDSPYHLAENIIHETAHQKLFALGIRKESCDGFVANSRKKRLKSPVVPEYSRPMTALVHEIYAYMYVTAFNLSLLQIGLDAEDESRVRGRIDKGLRLLGEGAREMKPYRRADRLGQPFFEGFDLWLDEILDRAADVVG